MIIFFFFFLQNEVKNINRME